MNPILFIISVLRALINLYIFIVFIACVLSFVAPYSRNKFVQFFYRLTDPAFKFVRRYLPTAIGGFDLSPLIIFFSLQILDMLLVRIANAFNY